MMKYFPSPNSLPPLSDSHNQLKSGFINPLILFIAGVALTMTGFGLNYFLGMKGVLLLEAGKEKKLVSGISSGPETDSTRADLGLSLTLDSVTVYPYIPQYEIELWRRDTTPPKPHAPMSMSSSYPVGRHPLEQMKIIKIENSEYRFRLKEFYPNFEFAYEYPVKKDTISPRAPGITLELKTVEGTPMVTLLANEPGRNKLGDIVSLGATLAFYWEISSDSVKAIASKNNTSLNQIIFAGANRMVYFISNDSIHQQPLNEQSFYKMPGQDSIGYKILHCFPDASYLKAVPSTRDSQLLNPVAHLEIWRQGEGSVDAFVYPQTRIRKGGEFEIPGSNYKIGLGIANEQAIKNCDCSITIQKEGDKNRKSLAFLSGKPRSFNGYRFYPKECITGAKESITLEIVHKPGKNLYNLGFLLVGMAITLSVFSRKRSKARYLISSYFLPGKSTNEEYQLPD